MQQIIGLVAAGLLFLTGLAGTFLPVLPGAPLILAGMLVYGLIAGFENLDVPFFIIQGLLVAAVIAADYLSTALGSRYFGGSKVSSFGAAAGMVLGLITFNLPGLLIGSFAGAVLAELVVSREIKQAVRAGLGAVIGFLASIPVKLTLEIIMIVWFFIRVF